MSQAYTPSTEYHPTTPRSGTLVLVRHGERADFVKTHPWYSNRVPRRRDPPLTDTGVQLATRTGERLWRDGYAPRLCTEAAMNWYTPTSSGSGSDIDMSNGSTNGTVVQDATNGLAGSGRPVVFSSPLARCLMTAAPIAARLGAVIVVVYSLAKSTAYFRRVKAGRYGPGVVAEVAGPEEAQRIVANTDTSCTGVQIAQYVDDDRRTCRGALDRLCRAAAKQGRVALVAGHSESQLELARLAGERRMEVPYCGVATLAADGVDNGPVRWRIVETPLEHRALCLKREQEDVEGVVNGGCRTSVMAANGRVGV